MEDELDHESVAITAMYMAMGADAYLKSLGHAEYESIIDFTSGHIGIMGELAALAVKSEQRLKELQPMDFPGVYDYEVSEPFGAWYAETRLSHTGDPTEELYRRIDEFFHNNSN